MSFARQITNRKQAEEPSDVPVSRPTSPAAARAAVAKPRAWAEAFMREQEETGLPIATLVRIMRENETHEAATAKATEALAAGQGHAGLRTPARIDAAARIGAAHAKAHQPRRATRH